MKKLIKYIWGWFKRKSKEDNSPVGFALGIYLDGEKIGEAKPARFTFSGNPMTPTFSFEGSYLTLDDMLEEAVANEDYERAAELRDLIKAENDIHPGK